MIERLTRTPLVYRGTGLVLIALGLVAPFAGRPTTDTAWLQYLAHRMLSGDRLYVDLIEANPPLIVWLNLPAALLSRMTGLPGALLYNMMVLCLGIGSVLVCRSLLSRLLPETPALQRYLTLALIAILFPLIRGNFGQREHLALLLLLPFALLSAMRIRNVPTSRVAAIVIGAAAGLGIALKPYFMLPWLGLELTVFLATRRLQIRPESVTIVACGAAYLVAVSWFAREYWSLTPLMAGGYYDFLRNSLAVTALAGEGAAPALAALLLALMLRQQAAHPWLWLVIGALGAGFYVAAVAQHKGWEYHFYPAYATGMLLLALVSVDLKPSLTGIVARGAAAVARSAVVTVVVITAAACVAQALSPRNRRYDPDTDLPDLLPVVSEYSPRGPVMILSWSAASTFPLVSEAGARSASRFVSLWMMAGLYGAAAAQPEPISYRSREQMGGLERYLNDAMTTDLARNRPVLLVVLMPAPDRPEWGLRRIDLLGYLTRNPAFATEFERYRYARSVGQYWIFERLPEGAPPAPARVRVSRWDPSDLEVALAARSARTVDPWPVAAILLFLVTLGITWPLSRRPRTRLQPAGSEST
jgi:hypothetical protein